MFWYCICAIRSHPKNWNKFVEVAAVAERYLIITHIKIENQRSSRLEYNLPVKLSDGRILINKKEELPSYLVYNIVSFRKMAGKAEHCSWKI